MRLKKSITMFLLIVLLVSQFSFIRFNNFVYAVDEQASRVEDARFHYNQLNSEAKKIYSAMYEMYTNGTFKTGMQNYDLAQNDKYVTQEQLQSYTNGNTTLKEAMNAARYAFYADYPEVFYVNFQKLTLRVTKGNDDRYHAYLGSGSKANYYIEGFTNQEQVEEAIKDFDEKVNEIVTKVENITVEEGKNLTTEKIKKAHNEIIYHTGYRLESDCTPGNEGFLGTPYGALVKQQAVCEGYARAFKTVLDKLGINSILVQGTHQSEGSAAVPHMWNYVEIEKETLARTTGKVWYAVDSTLDDPFLRKTPVTPDAFPNPGDDIEEGFENTRYCLVGTETMNREHVALETVEAAGNYVFQYPELNAEDYGIDAITNSDGLYIKYKQDGTQTEEYKAGDYYISYNGKGYGESAKEGKYIIMKSYYYKPGDEKWDVSPWAYFLPEVYVGGFRDYDDHIYLTMPNSEYVEFAVTTLAPGDYQHDPKYLAYQGDESDFVAKSGKLYNPSGTYKGRPYIKTQTPGATASITVGPTYHVDVTYDDDLVLAEGATKAGYKLESTGPTGADETEITNFTFDGKRRITFDLKFSKMWADDGAGYKIYITGIVGKNSGKQPMEITYGAVNQISCSYRMNKAKNWEVFARPTLLENEDLSMNEWKTSDGTPVSDKLKSRIALVTTRTTKTESDAMNNLMENELQNQELVTSQTYNISLNVCKKYVVKTGHRLRLSLGFPAGYGPDDAGVTFKAYHFIRNDKGEVTGVEEIPCVITQYGLIITCDSFSPFAIAVVENDGSQVSPDKTVIVSDSEGGTITGANREEGNILTLKENESKTVNIKAEEGYQIEAITVCGEVVEIANKDAMDITINYDDVKDGNCIVDAKFVAKTIVQQEEAKGEIAVQETAIPANITEMPQNVVGTLNRKLTINPTIEEPEEGIVTYQWYKDDEKLEGKTNKTLTIATPTEADEGTYILKATTTAGTVSSEATSTPCTVTISSVNASMKLANEDINKEELKPGQEFEVKVSVNDFKNIGKGLISLMGQLEYDTNILERIDVDGQNGWNLGENSFNEENFKFIIDSNKLVTDSGDIFKMKFRVKNTVTEEAKTVIKVKGISASGGDGIVGANDTSIEVGIKLSKEPAKITSDKYVIEKTTIARVAPGTTLKTFKENVEANREIVILDKDGNELEEDSALGTNMTLKVGEELQYTIIVTGDIDGDTEITTNDLAQLKVHLIDYEKLTGNSLIAADVDNDKEVTINDLAQIKLVLINLLEIQ